MSYLYVSSINRPDEKSFSRKVGTLKKNNIREVFFIDHEVPKFLYVLVHTFNRVTGNHQILVFILALFLSCKNLLDIVSLMLRLARNYRPIDSLLVYDFDQSSIGLDSGVFDEQNLSQICID